MGPQLGGIETQASKRAWSEVLDKHVCTVDEPMEQLGVLVGLEVKDNRLFAVVRPCEVRTVAASGAVVAPRKVTG